MSMFDSTKHAGCLAVLDLILGCGVACDPGPEGPSEVELMEQERQETEQRNLEAITRLAEDVFTGGRLELLDQLVHPDLDNHSSPPGQRDRDSFRGTVEFWRSSLSDLRVEPIELVASGDYVSMVDRTSGIHDKAEFFGIPPNGQEFSLEAVHVFRMEDGMMREHWVQTSLAQGLEELAAAGE